MVIDGSGILAQLRIMKPFVLCASLFALWCQALSANQPNIVVILCDDLGYGDLSCYGHPHTRTPHLDQMAGDGIRFTDFYSAAPVCSPSRVGLLTGRTPNRAGIYDWIPPYNEKRHDRTMAHMREDEVTIAAVLKDAGYATCMSGKWHCNSKFNDPGQPQPGDFGFDHWFATQNNAAPSHENPVNFVRNGEQVGPINGYACQIVADEAIGWLREHHSADKEKPFFLYMAFHEPHEPVASPPDLVAKYQKVAKNEDEAQYFANVENLDLATGKLLAELGALGYRDNTLVVFTSDNGPETLNRYRSAKRSYGVPGELRGMKLHTHEAGYRVAGIMRWPEKIKAGQTVKTPVCSLDFLPTFTKLAGGKVPEGLELDGADFLPALSGKAVKREKPLAWCYYNALNESRVALRDGDWKILGRLKDLGRREFLTSKDEMLIRSTPFDSFEIYNLVSDVDESEDKLASPEAPLDQLAKKLENYYQDLVDDQIYWTAKTDGEATVTSNAKGTLVIEPGASGPGSGKHVVLVAGDEEYRSEEAMPMLAKILSQKFGYRCTVVFSMSEDGRYIDPNNPTGLRGLDALVSADLMIIGTRFRRPDADQAVYLTQYMDAGKPIIGIRTATHAFNGGNKFGDSIGYGEWGRKVLGEQWVNHHGVHKRQGARGVIERANADHPILRGVEDVFAPSDVYGVKNLTDVDTILMRGAVTESLDPKSPMVSGPKNDPMQAFAWLHPYVSPGGTEGTSFCTTAGAAVDLVSEDLRRLIVNAALHLTGVKVPEEADVAYADPFYPSFFGFIREPDYWKNADLQPEDFALGKSPSLPDPKGSPEWPFRPVAP
tara:strand:- start:13885 stop:16374 length:2490 start_codon:yes stop_codon:yes gene_type:complete